jgi:hypothetical protein
VVNMDFENRYLDVLQNIEFAIIQVYRDHPELTDHQVDKAMEGLVRTYQAEQKGRSAPLLKLGTLDQQVYDNVYHICQIRLGRESFSDEQGDDVEVPLEPLQVDEIVACLRHIRGSISTWTKDYGRQGYLDFIKNYLP